MVSDFDPNAAASFDGIFGLPFSPEEARVVLVPVPFDATTSYRRGAATGPAAILEASHQVDLYDVETGNPWQAGIAMLPAPAHIEALNVRARELVTQARDGNATSVDACVQVNASSEQVRAWVHDETLKWLDQGKLVGIIGGDHASPLGAIEAHATRFSRIGVLHVDAHADLRIAYEGFVQSHASIMHNVLERTNVERLVQVGVRDLCEAEARAIAASKGRVCAWYDIELAREMLEGRSYSELCARIIEPLPEHVYISFDIDGLEPGLCPRTGTPVPGGLSFYQAIYLIGSVVRSGRRIVGFDLCEVACDNAGDSIDAIVGARLLYKLIGWAAATHLDRPNVTAPGVHA